ncbi:hypothetical protein DRQ09_09670, partial [candidate division KSB1 bacterium]
MLDKSSFLSSIILTLGLEANCKIKSVEVLDFTELERFLHLKKIYYYEGILAFFRGKTIILSEEEVKLNLEKVFQIEMVIFSLLLLKKITCYTIYKKILKTEEESIYLKNIINNYSPII